MTSNIGSTYLTEGVNPSGEIGAGAKDAVMAELRRHFRPEFLNRVDDIVFFKPLTMDEIEAIVDLLVEELRERLRNRQIDLDVSARGARSFAARKGFNPVFGARPLRRFLQQELEDANRPCPDIGIQSRRIVHLRLHGGRRAGGAPPGDPPPRGKNPGARELLKFS